MRDILPFGSRPSTGTAFFDWHRFRERVSKSVSHPERFVSHISLSEMQPPDLISESLFSNYDGYTNYAYEHVAHSETEHLA